MEGLKKDITSYLNLHGAFHKISKDIVLLCSCQDSKSILDLVVYNSDKLVLCVLGAGQVGQVQDEYLLCKCFIVMPSCTEQNSQGVNRSHTVFVAGSLFPFRWVPPSYVNHLLKTPSYKNTWKKKKRKMTRPSNLVPRVGGEILACEFVATFTLQ